MRKLFQGMAFILFSIFLVLAAAFDPILSHFWGGGLHLILDLLALILGIVEIGRESCRERVSLYE